MKKFIDILTEIENISTAITAEENPEKRIDLKFTHEILKNNAKIALFYEVMPIALEILEKYKGKLYNDETRNKITKEVKNKTGCLFDISTSSGQYVYNIYFANYHGNYYNIVVGAQAPFLTAHKKIQIVPFENLKLLYMSCEYIEDIPLRIAKLKQLYKKAVEIKEQLEAVCEQYNSLAIGDIEYIYYGTLT